MRVGRKKGTEKIPDLKQENPSPKNWGTYPAGSSQTGVGRNAFDDKRDTPLLREAPKRLTLAAVLGGRAGGESERMFPILNA
jgi:hypothetical protein